MTRIILEEDDDFSTAYFASYFSDNSRKQVQTLTGLNKHGHDVNKKIVKYLQKIIDIEQEYSDALSKLSKIEFPSLESVMKSKLKSFKDTQKKDVKSDHQKNPDAHLVKILEDNKKYYKEYKQEHDKKIVELKNIRNRFQKFINDRKQYKADLKNKLTDILDQKEALKNKKKKLASESRNLEEKRDDLISKLESNPPDADKYQEKIDKIKGKLMENEKSMHDIGEKLKEIEVKLETEMNNTAAKVFENERNRLSKTYERLGDLCKVMKAQQQAAQTLTEEICTSISKGKPQIELEDFAKRYGSAIIKA